MNLESLLNASLELEKRIASDQALRKCFSSLWQDKEIPKQAIDDQVLMEPPKGRTISMCISEEIYTVLIAVAKTTGQSFEEIFEESFREYCQKRFKDPFSSSSPNT